MTDEELRQTINEVREMKQMCGNINMKLTNIVTQRGQSWKAKLEAEYQRGLDDAWEAARKIVLSPDEGGMSLTDIYLMFGNSGSMQRVFRSYSASEAIDKLKVYEEKRKADDEIKVGDEVERSVYGRAEGKGIYLEDADEEGDWLRCLFWTGATFTVLAHPKKQLKKTGRHFDIASILKEMQS